MALPGGYPNHLAGGDANPVAKSFGRNAERLIKAKRHYDPDNVFPLRYPAAGRWRNGRLIPRAFEGGEVSAKHQALRGTESTGLLRSSEDSCMLRWPVHKPGPLARDSRLGSKRHAR
jgi:hypothetical protein